MERTPLRPRIRWMIRRDLPDVLRIERGSFAFPWSEDDFVRCLRQRNCIGMVAEVDFRFAGETLVRTRIVGFVVYELLQTELHLLNLAVDRHDRLQGVGAEMVKKLKSKLFYGRRDRIVLEVRETNLDAQLFFKRQGFRAVDVLRDYYDDVTEDAYQFVYAMPKPEPVHGIDGGDVVFGGYA